MIRITLLLLLASLSFQATAQRLGRFSASNSGIGYQHIKSYYGFIEANSKPDTVVEEKEIYYLFFHLNDSLPDLGLRIVNPVPKLSMPDKGDAVSDNYYEHEKDKSGRFNTWLALEKQAANGWKRLEFNDDGNELPEATNSVIRIKDKKVNRLTPGNYRIVISTAGIEKISGGFLVQIGSSGSIKTANLSRTLSDSGTY